MDCGECGLLGGPNQETALYTWEGLEDGAPVISFGVEVEGDCGAVQLVERLRWDGSGVVLEIDAPVVEISASNTGAGTEAVPWSWDGGVSAFVEEIDPATLRIVWSSTDLEEVWICAWDDAAGLGCEPE